MQGARERDTIWGHAKETGASCNSCSLSCASLLSLQTLSALLVSKAQPKSWLQPAAGLYLHVLVSQSPLETRTEHSLFNFCLLEMPSPSVSALFLPSVLMGEGSQASEGKPVVFPLHSCPMCSTHSRGTLSWVLTEGTAVYPIVALGHKAALPPAL